MAHQGQGNLDDFRAQFAQAGNSGDNRRAYFGVNHFAIDPLFNHAHFQAANIPGQGGGVVGNRRGPGIGVLGIVAGNGLQGQGAVGHGAGNGAGGIHRPTSPLHPVAADPPPGRAYPHQAAKGGRAANGAAGILTDRSGAQAGGGGGPGAAAGSAGIAAQIPGIAGAAVGMMKSVAAGKLAHIQLAQQDSPGRFQLGDHGGIPVGDMVGQDGGAAGGGDALGVQLVFHRHRDAVQRPPIVAGGDFPFRFLGGGLGFGPANGDVGMELPVHPVNALQVGGGGFHRGNFPGLQAGGQFGGRQKGNFRSVHNRYSPGAGRPDGGGRIIGRGSTSSRPGTAALSRASSTPLRL